MPESTRPVCLITGGTSGLGLATAMRFARDRYRLVICGRDHGRLARSLEMLETAGSKVSAHALDLCNPTAPAELVRNAVDAFGRIDVLINNAAAAPLGSIDELPESIIDSTIALNVSAIYRIIRAAWPVMKGQGIGIIVNISSLAAIDPFPGFSLYGATKAWLELLTLALAREGREFGIRTYGIRPGTVETPMLRGLFPDFAREKTLAPEHVADLIAECCSPHMKYSSGTILGISNQ